MADIENFDPMPVAIIGAGPAGLMAAEVLSQAGVAVHVFDAMPSAGRKFLLAGRGGLNLTHSEPTAAFATRYGARSGNITPLLAAWDAQAVRNWAQGLGVETFVGTSGRVFPTDMKAAPLLRAWLHRLRNPQRGPAVQFHMRHRWLGWDADGALVFRHAGNEVRVHASNVVLALGGASWARLGSDGAWVPLVERHGLSVAPLRPANSGFDLVAGWTPYFRDRFAGQPFKSVAVCLEAEGPTARWRKGEFVATQTGIEGSLVYAVSSLLRDEIDRSGSVRLYMDLLPQVPLEQVHKEVSHPRGSRSLSNHLKSRLNLTGIKAAVLREVLSDSAMHDPAQLAATIKCVPLQLGATRPLDEAISTAGGVRFEDLTPHLMARQRPGVFFAGEMLDWEAPTGGYLLQACLSSGVVAGQGVVERLKLVATNAPS